MDATWKRASTPEQKEERRRSVIQAAIDVLERDGPVQAGMSAIAREVGLSKGNLYRYFESREAIYLHVLLEDQKAWVERVVEALEPLAGSDDAAEAVRTLVRELVRRPRLLTLAPLVSSLFEHNVPVELVVWFKRSMAEALTGATHQLQVTLPSLTPDDIDRLMAAFHHLVNGMAPAANPPLAVRNALQGSELAQISTNFENELEDLLVTVIYGLRAHPLDVAAVRLHPVSKSGDSNA